MQPLLLQAEQKVTLHGSTGSGKTWVASNVPWNDLRTVVQLPTYSNPHERVIQTQFDGIAP